MNHLPNSMKPIKHKVLAYITRQNRLLVFHHIESPEAGIQVPGGTVEPDEDLLRASLREAEEETGLRGLVIESHLGDQIRDMADVQLNVIHHRHFYPLRYEGDAPEIWCHDENDPSDGTPAPIRLEFYWATMPYGIPELICDQGIMLPTLKKQFAFDA